MTTLNFSTTINAPKEKVWNILWNDDTYRQWTAVFPEGSHAESDWKEGSKIRFLGPKGSGMWSIIKKKTPAEEMAFEHQGEIKDGVEQVSSWAGAKELYHLRERAGVTELNVEMDVPDEFKDYFNNTFPKAFAVVKELAEQP